MDPKRILLYLLLGIVSLALWDAWQKEHVNVAPQQIAQQQTTNSQDQVSQIPTTKVAESATTNIPEVKTEIPSSRLIHVVTDVLDVSIDTEGGNIVKANLLQYPLELHSKEPYSLLGDTEEHLFVTQSGFISSDKNTAHKEIHYTTSKKEYVLGEGENELVVKLEGRDSKGVMFSKAFKFKRDKYLIDVDFNIENKTNNAWSGKIYTQLQRRNGGGSKKAGGKLRFHTYVGAAISTPEKKYEKIKDKAMRKYNLDRVAKDGWASMQEHYFISAWIPDSQQVSHYYSRVTDGDIYTIGMLGPRLNIAPGTQKTATTKLYAGPEIAERLQAAAPGLDLTVDYGWLWFISVAIFWLMKHIYSLVGNWGWAIVLVTVVIKLLFYHLSASSYKSMAKNARATTQDRSIKTTPR